MSADNFFIDLDRGFINFEASSTESFNWNATDIIVQYEWSFSIPVFLPGSTLSYSFKTEFGDISFGVKFLTHDGSENIVRELSRVPSDIEAITGSFRTPRDGKVVFIWDNNFSWFTSKTLAYSIELHQVCSRNK